MSKFIEISRGKLSTSIAIAKKFRIYFGSTDRWGFAVGYNHYDRALTVELVHWYMAIEFWYYELR